MCKYLPVFDQYKQHVVLCSQSCLSSRPEAKLQRWALRASSSSSAFPAVSPGFAIIGEIFCVCDSLFVCFLFFCINSTIKVVTFRLCRWHMVVDTGCTFVAIIQPSGTLMSECFESVRWNACVHRLDLSLYSHPKEL